MSTSHDTAVTIIGGSLVGLSAAVFLAARKVPVVVLERRTDFSSHPRANNFTTRTWELYKNVGLEDRVPPPPPRKQQGPPRRVQVEAIAGKWSEEAHWGAKKEPAQTNGTNGTNGTSEKPQVQAPAPPKELSPVKAKSIPQDLIEPVLRNRAIELGADVRQGWEMVSFEQDDAKVTVKAKDSEGKETSITSQYLIGCDGARGRVRDALGIEAHGIGHLRTLRSILFRCEAIEKYLDTGFEQFMIKREDMDAFVYTYHDGRWAFMWNDESDVVLSEDERRNRVLSGIGDSSLGQNDVELLTQGAWALKGAIADKFSSGRVFLAGDSAHTLPPNRGGWGANTGIPDAHNLSWKIEAVYKGLSSPALLDTYSTERQQVSYLRHNQLFAHPDMKNFVAGKPWDPLGNEKIAKAPVLDNDAVELGQIYESRSIVDDTSSLPIAKLPEEWQGQPGTRAPHIRLEGGNNASILDLFHDGWVLLSSDASWEPAMTAARKSLGWTEGYGKFVQVGQDIKLDADSDDFETVYGISKSGATLVRPDGFISWRSKGTPYDAKEALLIALKQASCN